MASYNLPIFTQNGNDFIKNVIAGKNKIKFTHIIYSSDDYDAKSDDDLAKITDLTNKELSVTPQTFLDQAGNVNIRANANNDDLKNDLYVKSYGLYVTGENSNQEVLLAIATSQSADFLPAATNYVANLVSYTFTIGVSNTSTITFSDKHYISVNMNDLDDLKGFISQNYVNKDDFNEARQKLQLGINNAQQSAKDINLSGAIAAAFNQSKTYVDNKNYTNNSDVNNILNNYMKNNSFKYVGTMLDGMDISSTIQPNQFAIINGETPTDLPKNTSITYAIVACFYDMDGESKVQFLTSFWPNISGYIRFTSTGSSEYDDWEKVNDNSVQFFDNDSDAQNAGKNAPAGTLLIVRDGN
ncbi:hypothetical protein DY120_07410 [Apilactobacillus micheneri]|uniref:BppU N-terminal domain-containing protein n=1 Tax=Apilactobacillus micheneri TaxID=1899430 RepID=A0ABY2YVW3_9LACO|nr:hypothetical protein [Apilactobacillus micheneri]TPR23125.1 hypothetical protein DY114_07395 [Apilactobacillus micheneri]TPR24443.1 hypothetical protein DY111_07410 [Apilactobacillus micheneri]TPR29390.1 hypothetical protein DY120_07410 [Apilactobacillus micheneri]TPR34597.1 hypothetical protein DY027_07400 [Apilactobacillus micheneri]